MGLPSIIKRLGDVVTGKTSEDKLMKQRDELKIMERKIDRAILNVENEMINLVKEAKKVNDPALIQGFAANYNARQWQKNNYIALKNNILQARIDIENKIATLRVMKEFGVMNKELVEIKVPELSEEKIDDELNKLEKIKEELDAHGRQTQITMKDIFNTTSKSGIELDKETTRNFMDMVGLSDEEVIKKVRNTSFAK